MGTSLTPSSILVLTRVILTVLCVVFRVFHVNTEVKFCGAALPLPRTSQARGACLRIETVFPLRQKMYGNVLTFPFASYSTEIEFLVQHFRFNVVILRYGKLEQ